MHLRLLVAGLLGLTVASAARAERVPCEVRHVSADHVYLGCGEADGVAVGDTIPVFRNGARIGTLVVRHVASSTASCRVASGETPKPQDLVLVSGAPPVPAATPERDTDTIADTAPLTPSPPRASATGSARHRWRIFAAPSRWTGERPTTGGTRTWIAPSPPPESTYARDTSSRRIGLSRPRPASDVSTLAPPHPEDPPTSGGIASTSSRSRTTSTAPTTSGSAG